MKAGIVSGNTLYVMGIVPGDTSTGSNSAPDGASEITILGIPRSSIYGATAARIVYKETFTEEGSFTAQALAVADASREFFPVALIIPLTNSENVSPTAERIMFCCETSYVLCKFFRQSSTLAYKTVTNLKGDPDMPMSERHALAFIRRANADDKLRDSAWGAPERAAKGASARAIRTVR
jgi:hypothetical protein